MVISLRLGRGSEVQEQTNDSLAPLALSFMISSWGHHILSSLFSVLVQVSLSECQFMSVFIFIFSLFLVL